MFTYGYFFFFLFFYEGADNLRLDPPTSLLLYTALYHSVSPTIFWGNGPS